MDVDAAALLYNTAAVHCRCCKVYGQIHSVVVVYTCTVLLLYAVNRHRYAQSPEVLNGRT